MVLDDPNPNLTPEEVQAHFAALYPEVASAKVEGPILKEDKQEFILRSGSVGVKG
jgi:PRTRC genetic system protein C